MLISMPYAQRPDFVCPAWVVDDYGKWVWFLLMDPTQSAVLGENTPSGGMHLHSLTHSLVTKKWVIHAVPVRYALQKHSPCIEQHLGY